MAPFNKSRSLDKAPPPSSIASSSNATDDFSARRSARVAAGKYAADGDTWVEALAVCEIPAKAGHGDSATAAASKKNGGGGGLFRKFKSSKSMSEVDAAANGDNKGSQTDAEVAAASQRLTLRPYFQSQNTDQRVWDEPPSGASNIVYATPEARKMAQAQLEEMRSTYAHAALARRVEREEKKALEAEKSGKSSKSGGGGSKFVPKVFKRSSSASASSAAASAESNQQSSSLLGNNHSNTRIKGSLVSSDGGGRNGIPQSILEESKELAGDIKSNYEADLQRAMLMSMGVGGGSVMGVGDTSHGRSSSSKSRHNNSSSSIKNGGSRKLTREEEEQLAMATALSLSEQEARQGNSTRRSRSYPNRKGGSDNSSNGSSREDRKYERERSKRSQSSSLSSSSKYADITAGMEPSLSDFDDDFDGGGKMPARQHCTNNNTNSKGRSYSGDNMHNNDGGNFGDRGPSWELSWSHSGSPKKNKKDWGHLV